MGKNKGVTHAEVGTGEDAGSKNVREGESFCQTPDARCNGEKLASERERAKRHTCFQTRKTTQRGKKTGRERFYYNHSARWREGLQPDQSRRWSRELIEEQGTGRRLSAEGRSPRLGALGRLTRAEGKHLLSLSVLPFSLYTLLSNGIPYASRRLLLL